MARSNCNNCGAPLSCGCQRRTSVNGKSCCKQCVASENSKVRNLPKGTPVTRHRITINK